MTQSEGHLDGAGGRSIYFQVWQGDTEVRAVLLLAHGAGEHSGRYAGFARFFTARGFAVAALDHHGHGHSDGVPGYTANFGDYIDDLERLRQQHVTARFPGIPVFLVGHSLGGLIAAQYLFKHRQGLVGAVLSGAAIVIEDEPGGFVRRLLRLLARFLPRLPVTRLDAGRISRDPAVVRDYQADPLVLHGALRAGMVDSMFDAMAEVRRRAGEISLPLLVLHGGADVLTAPAGSQLLYDRAGSADKTLKIYPGLYHEIFNEPERESVLGDVFDWCEARLTER